MKAWIAYVPTWEDADIVVFAETSGKAKSVYKRWTVYDCEVEFTDIRVYRAVEYDKCYHGQDHMDWENQEERLTLVRDFGWHCAYASSGFIFECEKCLSKEHCKEYEAYLQWERSLNENGEP